MATTSKSDRDGYEHFKANSKVVDGARDFVYDDSESEEIREEKRLHEEALEDLYQRVLRRSDDA